MTTPNGHSKTRSRRDATAGDGAPVTGDHDTTNPQHLPSSTPGLLRQIITDTLTNPPHQRPLPEAWTYVLGHAIEQAQHRKKTAAAAAPVSVALDPPPTPVVHSRPTTAKAHSRPPVSAPPSMTSHAWRACPKRRSLA